MGSLCCLDYVLVEESDPTYLDWDPVWYEVSQPRRSSSHPTMSGSRVWQDFGAPDVDGQIRLRTDWMSEATLDAFKAKFAAIGEVWKWVDHLEREYRVFFRSLNPERIRGHEAYQVEMTFDVVEVVV